MPRITGKDGTVLVGPINCDGTPGTPVADATPGSSFGAKIQNWAMDLNSENVKGRAMGDGAQVRTHLFYDWKVEAEAHADSNFGMGSQERFAGTFVTIGLKARSSDSQPLFLSGGFISAVRRKHAHDANSNLIVTFESGTGLLPILNVMAGV